MVSLPSIHVMFIHLFFFYSQISDLKRLNKIEKEIEIHARKTLKVPMNAHNVLLNTMTSTPVVHKSGQNSPKQPADAGTSEINSSFKQNASLVSIAESSNLLLSHNIQGLNEKLLVAAVSCASTGTTNGHINYQPTTSSSLTTIRSNDAHLMNDIIMNSTIATRSKYRDAIADTKSNVDRIVDSEYPLLLATSDSDDGDYATLQSGPHVIRGAPRNDFSCSGSDCDISWICLLVVILALCFAIPLIYVIYIAEHPEEFTHKSD